ncbi:MAG: hypothetical protein PHW77_04645 [Eubacteriales bacterium]|nr:hypothetical protein [Eubacteriales bacterium]
MKNKTFGIYYLLSVVSVLLASFYPLYMGIRVITDMLQNGTVLAGDYPKYIIPYTPISIALILGVILMPLAFRFIKRFAVAAVSVISLGAFFLSELLLESKVIVTSTVTTTLESWQMFMCYVPPEGYGTRTWTTVDVLLGEYNPTFKIHFYLISVVIILTVLNCVLGFGKMIKTHDKRRLKSLIIQAISSFIFIALCIFACFTAFYRNGELTVSALSAVLMCLFFVIFGLTSGVYIGSFLLGKRKLFSVLIPAVVSSVITLAMYLGEMILLSGHLYRFGKGFFFEKLGHIVLAPVDICVILISGCICAMIMIALRKNNTLPVNNDNAKIECEG